MNYFDTSYLIPLVKPEPLSDRVAAFVEEVADDGLVTSQWTIVECRSALAREVRMERLSASDFRSYCRHIDEIMANSFQIILPIEEDFRSAATMIEAPETGLRAGDAMHVAIAQRLEAQILTLDRRMTTVARRHGIRAGYGF
jgi:predicted nucleic acid-binding protein